MTGKPDPLTSVYGGPKLPGGTSLSSLFTWLGTRGDYSSIDKREKALIGWRRQFSSITKEGRFNMVIGTYLAVFVTGIFMWRSYRGKKGVSEEASS